MEGRKVMSFLKSAGGVLGTISPALGAITGKGLGGDILGTLSPALGMLTGKWFGWLTGGGGDSAEQPAAPVQPERPPPTGAARGLGNLIGVDPNRIGSIASDVGRASNVIAQAGGAEGSYPAPDLAPQNHLQLLDRRVVEEIIRKMGARR
jgi:hypothetical protein